MEAQVRQSHTVLAVGGDSQPWQCPLQYGADYGVSGMFVLLTLRPGLLNLTD